MFGPSQPLWLNRLTYVLAFAIALGLILTSYIENYFYDTYIKGEPYLVWTVYIFPWVIILWNGYHIYDNWKRERELSGLDKRNEESN